MELSEYFRKAKGYGVIGTADADGKIGLAIYARPHFINEKTVAFIMADRLMHKNLQSNPHASYLFVEAGGGVITEISDLVNRGFDHFHLCDSEFNEDLDYCLDFCSSLRDAGIGIRWAVYMKPGNYSQKLFRFMQESGVYLVTLTVDSFRKCPLYWEDVEKMVNLARSSGIRMAIDFLTGFPYETKDDVVRCLDAFRRIQPDTVGVNTYIRLYQSLAVSRIIRSDRGLGRFLLGNSGDGSLIRPVFYNYIDAESLAKLIDSDPLFRIEGLQKGVNYTRVQ